MICCSGVGSTLNMSGQTVNRQDENENCGISHMYLFFIENWVSIWPPCLPLPTPLFSISIFLVTKLYVLTGHNKNYDHFMNWYSLFYNAKPKHHFCFPIWLLVFTFLIKAQYLFQFPLIKTVQSSNQVNINVRNLSI